MSGLVRLVLSSSYAVLMAFDYTLELSGRYDRAGITGRACPFFKSSKAIQLSFCAAVHATIVLLLCFATGGWEYLGGLAMIEFVALALERIWRLWRSWRAPRPR